MASLDKELSLQENAHAGDKEIERILACCKDDYYAIFDVLPSSEVSLTKIYRKKSLLIHPDKSTNKKAPQAFELLNNANNKLKEDSDELKRLEKIYTDVSKDTNNITKIREQVATVLSNILKEEQIEALYNQQAESKRQAEISKAREERENKRKFESMWEDSRDLRVKNWREFSSKIDKKKKRKKVLA